MTASEAYFANEPIVERQGDGRYVEIREDLTPIEFVPGLVFRPVIGERMLVSYVRYQPNTVAPTHVHAEEQVTFVIEGEFEFDLDGDVRMMRPGMAVRHARWDVFSPPRQVLVEAVRAAESTAE